MNLIKATKKLLLLGIILLLVACSHCYERYPNLQNENWISMIDTCPSRWTLCADRWFTTGEPNRIEQANDCAPNCEAITTSVIRTCAFSGIQVDGPFEVQIIGSLDHNSVTVLGPGSQVRQVVAEVHDGVLYLHTFKNLKMPLNKVIVRVTVTQLCKLISHGPCLIEGRGIISRGLVIHARGSGSILIEGNMNLRALTKTGKGGTVTVMGANTEMLNMIVKGPGNVNVSGRVGIQNIIHLGNGRVNIVGADTDCLRINAAGAGFTGIYGIVNLKRLTARNHSCVFIYWVNANDTQVFVHDNASVGLAGRTCNLTVNTFDHGRFFGSYLRAREVYVRSYNQSHANVAPTVKLFASTLDNGSVYYLGSPPDISRFSAANSVILAVGPAPDFPILRPCFKITNCYSPPPVPQDWSSYQPEVYK